MVKPWPLPAASFVLVGVLLVACGGPRRHEGTSRHPSTTVPSSSAPTTSRPTSALPTASIELLSAGNGIAVVADDPLTGAGCSTLLASSDLAHWFTIDPPQQPTGSSVGQGGTCPDVWESASFISLEQGWVLGRVGGNVTTVLFHTVNGGRSWTAEPGSTTASNGGSQVIGFTSAEDGWRQQFAFGSNASYLLESTDDGGATWREFPQMPTNGGCEYAEDVFANPQEGFAGSSFAMTGADQAEGMTTPQSWLWQTDDGGLSWHHMTTAPPPGLTGATSFYDLPTFFNPSDGVLPVLYSTATVKTLAFYVSTDGGQTWRLSASVPTSSSAQRTLTAGLCGTQVSGAFPMVSVAGATTWWVIGSSGASVSVTTDGGQSWATSPTASLGFAQRDGNAVQSLNAFNSSTAWLSTTNETTGTQLWQTTNGGQSWVQVTTASLEAAVTATALPSCADAQLAISPGRTGAGLGHIGEALVFTNVSQSACTLYGYPGVAALDSAGTQIFEATRTTTGYLGGLADVSNPVPLVTLLPGRAASALVEGTDDPTGPGPDPPPCPVDEGLLVTAPNTTRSVHLPAGPTLCSGLQVHPVVPGSSGSEGN